MLSLAPLSLGGEALTGLRFLLRLPGYLRRPISLEQARAVLRRRFERREPDFLRLVRQTVYNRGAGPYWQLFRLAGCEYGDLERLVSDEGLEGALCVLYRQGVYLTLDEFKGRRPAVRGSTTVAVSPPLLRNPRAGFHVLAQTGASRGASTPVPMDLEALWDRAVNTLLTLDARGGAEWSKGVWYIPGGSVGVVVRFSSFGPPVDGWFLQVPSSAPGLHPRYRWSERALRLGSSLARVPLPRPSHVPVDHPLPIARWMAELLRSGRTPHLWTFPSSAVRLCQAAIQAGIDLRGAQFTITGEPVTAARLQAIRSAGAEAVPDYGTAESGFLTYGCLSAQAPDDVHVFHDLHALVQPVPYGDAALPPRALFVSSLRPTAPMLLLNVSLGDQACMAPRTCGCPLERLGWTTHLHTIRSFEKLTAGGMTFLDTDVIQVLDEVLPNRFGGGPTDYQLVEEEGEAGRPRLRLLVRPSVGPLDETAVVDALLIAIGSGSGAQKVMALQWRQSGLLHVERRAPLTTAAGKILHLHQVRT